MVGCAVLGFGVFMEVAANVIMLPGEATANTISTITGRDFGTVKVCVDVSMCVIAVLLSLLLFRELQGVREGTVVSALLVGFLSGLFQRCLGTATQKLFVSHTGDAQPFREQISEG